MPQCAVATCRNSHRRTRGRRIRYHRFPQIPEVRMRWVRACGRPPLANGDVPFNIQTARICSLHFTNDSYEKDMEHLVLGLPVRSRLRRGAVPTIGVPVNVQPVTKMLVEDAKRSILKVAHAKIISGERKLMDVAKEKRFYQKCEDKKMDDMYQYKSTFRQNDEQKIGGIDVLLALGLKPASRLNKMQSTDCPTTSFSNKNGNNISTKKVEDQAKDSSTIPQQNGNKLTGGIAMSTESTNIKKESPVTDEDEDSSSSRNKIQSVIDNRKRHSVEDMSNRSSKKICFEQREMYIDSLIGCERVTTAEELDCRAEELIREVKALDELARAKEMEWNEILSMRKLKEEAFLRLERRRQVMGFLEGNNGQCSDNLPAASLTLVSEWEENRHNQLSLYQQRQGIQVATSNCQDEKITSKSRLDMRDNIKGSQKKNITKKQKSFEVNRNSINIISSLSGSRRIPEDTRRCSKMRSVIGTTTTTTTTTTILTPSTTTIEPLQSLLSTSLTPSTSTTNLEINVDSRLVSEGREGPIVDVRSLITDHRLRNSENIPRRGQRNPVNIGLGTSGAVIETSHIDSRPSSTDSCKSNLTNSEALSFKDVLVQFAKLSQQQGEPVKTPENYPDVTLHPVTPSPISINPIVNSGQSGSLLHGILTKNQGPGPTNFSPTLAKLLTAPERERGNTDCGSSNSCASVTLSGGQLEQVQVSQNLLQAYQSSNAVSITDLLSSSKTRTEITITPVNSTAQPAIHSNSQLHVNDVDEEHLLSDSRDSRRSCSREHREDRDTPPRCQGCHDRAAQFVCAGCGNQWYCSRECQVAAWDEHSEVCSG